MPFYQRKYHWSKEASNVIYSHIFKTPGQSHKQFLSSLSLMKFHEANRGKEEIAI
jgi:hypothetical protein